MSPGEDDCCTACSQSRISKLLFFFVRPVVESPDCTILCNASWLFCGRHRAKLPCCCSAVRLLCSLRFWLSVRCSNASASSATPAVSSCSWQALSQAARPLWQSVPALQHHAPVPAARVFDAAAGGGAWLYAIAKVHCSRSRARQRRHLPWGLYWLIVSVWCTGPHYYAHIRRLMHARK